MNLRYAILRHEGIDDPHFDLLFETAPGSMLAAWRSPCWPLEMDRPIQRLPDHRPMYLDYEGEISGGRGSVTRAKGGSHIVRQDHPVLLIIELDDGTVLRLFRSEESYPQILRH